MHTLNIIDPMKVSNVEWQLKHSMSIMVVCENYMFGFVVSNDVKK